VVWVWLWWLGGILFLYVLSTGPVLMMVERGLIRSGQPGWRAAGIVYWPVSWAYQKTALHKPFGMYWHLWAPRLIDSKGNSK